MLLGNKKNQDKEQNWSLILNPVSSEIDRHKIAQKISEALRLSLDEALDLVKNTPIILLDNLPRATAVRAKDYFTHLNGEMFLSNDVFVKRKCYRTVWPEQPDISFLESGFQTQESMEPQYRLNPEEALYELRSLQELSPNSMSSGKKESRLLAPSSEDVRDASQIRRLEKEAIVWREKFEKLEEETHRLRQTLSDRESRLSDALSEFGRSAEAEKERIRQRDLWKISEQRLAALQEEYRQARVLYENKLGAAQEEAKRLKI